MRMDYIGLQAKVPSRKKKKKGLIENLNLQVKQRLIKRRLKIMIT